MKKSRRKQKPQKIDIKQYSGEILEAAGRYIKRRISNATYNSIELASAIMVGGPAVYQFIYGTLYGNLIYHLSGGLAYTAKAIIDTYATLKTIDETEDKRFFDYGLDKFIRERNPFFSKNPTRKEYLSRKKMFKELSGVLLSALFPPMGFGLAATSPVIYFKNTTIAKQIKHAKEIGDKVKNKIKKGSTSKQIRKYLKKL